MRYLCLAWSLLFSCLAVEVGAVEEGARREQVREAMWLGMDYMIRSALDPGNFEEYASDYLFFFADVVRLPDPWIQGEARRVGLELGDKYLSLYFTLDSADEVVDAASALYSLEQLGMDVQLPMIMLREAAGLFGEADYLGFDPSFGEAPNLDEFIDLVIGFHFSDRIDLGRDLGVTYAEVLHYLPSVVYSSFDDDDSDRFIDQNNLVTHLFYTLSGYASWNLDAALLPRETAYIRRHMDLALSWADPETLAEYIDSLKLTGEDESNSDIAHGVDILLAIQKADGRWEPMYPEDEYDRYHATWCVMDAFREYVLDGPNAMPDPRTEALLRRWAAQLALGRPMTDGLRIAPDKVNRPD